jgi:hypothetical protein
MQAPGKTKNFITALRTVRRYKRSLRNENLKLMKKKSYFTKKVMEPIFIKEKINSEYG